MAQLRIGDTAPNFDAQTTEGNINFYDWQGDNWVVLFSHPASGRLYPSLYHGVRTHGIIG